MPQYTRFWDVHLTANNGWYDFATEIRPNAEYLKSSKPDVLTEYLNLVDPDNPTGPTTLKSKSITGALPNKGVISSVVLLRLVLFATQKEDFKKLVAWVNHDAHVGKVRFTAHGSEGGGGKMLMWQDVLKSKADEISAEYLVPWLCKNGLKHEGPVHNDRALKRTKGELKGLVTICLASCCSGKAGSTANSKCAIDQVASALTAEELYSIRVTGCADPVAIRPTPEANRRLVRNNSGLSFFDDLGEKDLRREVKELFKIKELNTPQAKAKLSTMDFSPTKVDSLLLADLRSQVKKLEDLLVELEEVIYGPATARDSKPGQWGKTIKLADGSQKWTRLAKAAEKLFKDS